MLIVLDTNVLMSGIFFTGPPFQILKAWRDGNIQFALSSEIIDEYIRVARILSDQFPDIEVNPVLTFIIAHSVIIQAPPLPYQVCADPDDDKFLACALAAKSTIVISGDKHLLKISGHRGLLVLTPHAFLEQYLQS